MKTKLKSFLSVSLALTMLLSAIPMVSYAAQTSEYVDPAENWLTSNGRTNELDINSTTTEETQYCCVCEKETTVLTYRVPEYTRSGETALNRGVKYSDGTCIDGVSKGNLDDGVPGVDAKYTGYHFTKAVCRNCGTINTVDGTDVYNFNNNVYALNPCDHNFYVAFDATTHEPYDNERHTTTLKQGEYCQFCKGTYAIGVRGLAKHNFSQKIDAQVGNNRFFISEKCSDCGYETSEYITAKSVVSSYYGVEDGEAHTLTINDLSDNDVKTSIRYGTSAGNCTKTTAPSYVNPGYNAVYYKIEYTYKGETMTENGVSYVWILSDDKSKDNSGNDPGYIVVLPPAHGHEFHYLETVKPSCEELGYERFQCLTCGELDKRNYTPAKGHHYDKVVIREATCKQGGLILTLCSDCGDFYQETTALGEHKYSTKTIQASCRSVGYDEHTCEVCGHSYLNNMTSLVNHTYEKVTKAPDCLNKGYSTYTCTMCGSSYVDDYKNALGHNWDEGHTVTTSTCTGEGVVEYYCKNIGCNEKMIRATDATGHTPGAEATCTEPQLCTVCNTVLALPIGHAYSAEITAPTCTSSGFTTYRCKNCSETYTADYVDPVPHNYAETVTAPTCISMGFSTFKCKDCSDEYVGNYVDKLVHEYKEIVTPPTCTSMGYSTFICGGCDATYVGNYVDKTPHNYNKQVIPPTCTEHGHSVYTCPDCGTSYIDEIVESTDHHYMETVVPPTCSSLGYSVFKCVDCGDEYVGNYVDKLPHDYETTLVPATCTGLGYTTYQCKNCDNNYKSDYTEPTGHNLSDWIIDIPATIENAGAKHIECLNCGTTLQSAEIPQLIDEDRSDEDGNAKVGAFSIILTDSKNIPIFDSEITIDVSDNITIKLPEGRLLNYKDQTTITVFHTETQEAVKDLQIFIYDASNNAATGTTDVNGQLKVPNNQSSTGDDNGTIGKDEDEEKFTFVVRVTDKSNIVIPNCSVYIGESNHIVVDLPAGVKPSTEYPVIVTVTDQNGTAQKDVTIIALGDNDYIEKGKTDIYGRITLPMVSEGFTNNEGHVTVDNINVIVNDETGLIPDAFVKHNEDGSISVTLPEGKSISHANRTTVTVLDSEGIAIIDMNITVTDLAEKSYSDKTDASGKIVVPPLSEDYSDETGMAVVNGYNVLITDETKPIANAFVEIKDGTISITLPEGANIDYHNRITATITDIDGNPVKDLSVSFADTLGKTETNLTDASGKAVVPPVDKDITDVNGFSQVDNLNVTVSNETGKIENAFITHTEDGKIDVKLPDEVAIDINNRITVEVTDRDGTAMKDVPVIVTDSTGKTETNLTDESGKALVPPTNIDFTDTNGFAQVDGYSVIIKDEKGFVEKAFVTHTKDDTLDIQLPDNLLIEYSNRISVQVLDKESQAPVKGIAVTVNEVIVLTESEEETKKSDSSEDNSSDAAGATENNENQNESDAITSAGKIMTGTTDSNGIVVFPPISEDITDDKGDSSVTDKKEDEGKDTDGDGVVDQPGEITENLYRVSVKDTKGIISNAFVKIVNGKLQITLPDSHTLTTSNQTTVTVLDKDSKPVSGISVTITDKNNTSKTGTTNSSGQVTLPVKSSGGGGSSRPSGGGGGGSYSSYPTVNVKVTDKDGKNVSVSKSVDSKGNVTITLPADKTIDSENYYTVTVTDSKGEAKTDTIVTLKDRKNGTATGKTDKNGTLTLPATEHKAYILGYPTGEFRPDGNMTRSEAAAILARLISESKGETISGKSSFKDVNADEWYTKYVAYLEKYDVLKGYSDNTFRANVPVTRAEFVAMSVRYYNIFNELPTVADTTKYNDVSSNYWAIKEISIAKATGWLNGYSDGSFRGDNSITRAEAVTVINRATSREADKEYVNDNYTRLNRFTDVTDNTMWFFYDIMEACNTHRGAASDAGENWID